MNLDNCSCVGLKSKGGVEGGRREADVVVECNSSLKLSVFILELKGGREQTDGQVRHDLKLDFGISQLDLCSHMLITAPYLGLFHYCVQL